MAKGTALSEKQIKDIRHKIENILANSGKNADGRQLFRIEDWDQDIDPNSKYTFSYIPESGEAGAADYESERIEFVICGGEIGNGHWENYLDDLNDIFIRIKEKTGWEPVMANAEDDPLDDVFDISVVLYSPRNFDEELEEDIEKHDELNPKLFDGDNLKQEVVDKINEIVDVFLESLAEDGIKIKVDDIILVGSNVSYNYTKDSDLDIHIIADVTQLDCPDNLYPLLYGAYKSLFNKKMNINFYGIPVEVYVETDDTPLRSNGIYSVKDNNWIKKPDQESIPEIDYDEINELVQPYEDRFNEIKDDPSVDAIDQLITDIYNERKSGMSKEDGEFSQPNLVFKEFRNRGYLDQLKDLRSEALSKELSLESLQENIIETSKQVIAKQLGVSYETAVADIKKMIEDALEWEDMPIIIDTIEIYGSRRFGTPKETSDLDVALFYHSADEDDRVREDDLFNYLNSGFGDDDDYDDYEDYDDDKEDSEYEDTSEGHMYYRGYPLDINPHEDFTSEEIKNYMLNASNYKKEKENLFASIQHPLDERLSNSDIYSYKIKLQQITGHQGIVFNNGKFTINNIREDEVDWILQLLNREKKFIKNCHKIASGKWDFNHMKFMNMPSRYYTINGELNID